jgi:hypothetical protein
MESCLLALALDAGSGDEFAANEIDKTDAPSLRGVGSTVRPVGREIAEIELWNVVIVTHGAPAAVMEDSVQWSVYTKTKRHARKASEARPSGGGFCTHPGGIISLMSGTDHFSI